MDERELDRLFRTFTDSVFRLEARQHYAVPAEDERYRLFRQGHSLPPREPNPLIRTLIDEGKWVHRVHLVDLPLTDYLRYELAEYEFNLAEGEAVAIAERRAHRALRSLLVDFLLFDADTRQPALVWVLYDPDGEHLGWRRERDPDLIANAIEQRNLAIEWSVPLNLWKAAHRERLTA
jgi:hypothetical protein